MNTHLLIGLAAALITWPQSSAAAAQDNGATSVSNAPHPPADEAAENHHPESCEHADHNHEHGAACTEDHDHEHAHAEASHAGEAHEHGAACTEDHDHEHAHAEASHAGEAHEHGAACTEDHDHGQGGEGDAVIVSVDARSRHILNMQVEQVPAGNRTLVHSLYGYLTTPDHAVSAYAMPCAGRISLQVKSAQQVRKGDLLFTVDSPALYEQIAAVESVRAGLDRCAEELAALQERLDGLRGAGVRNSSLEEQQRFKKAEQRQLESDLRTAEARLKAQLGGGELQRSDDGSALLLVRAQHDGTVRNVGVSQGSWGEQGAPVITMSNTAAMEIIGSLYAGNMPHFTAVRALVPVGRENRHLTGTWRLAEQVDPQKLTRTLYFTPDELPAGVPAGQLCRLDLYDEQAENDGSIAVPDSALVKVGVDDVVFVEISEGQYAMLKVHAGTSRRGMTPVKGLMPGQRIVVKGGYELKYILPGEGQKKKAGHFHADGKFHEGEDH